MPISPEASYISGPLQPDLLYLNVQVHTAYRIKVVKNIYLIFLTPIVKARLLCKQCQRLCYQLLTQLLLLSSYFVWSLNFSRSWSRLIPKMLSTSLLSKMKHTLRLQTSSLCISFRQTSSRTLMMPLSITVVQSWK